MEIIGTNMAQKENKNKKVMIIISIFIVLLLLISIGLFISIYYLKSQQFKFYVDGTESSKSMTSDLFVYDGDTVYVSLKDVSTLIGYKYYKGGYKQYTEDTTKCYLESTNEVTTFEKDSDKIYKTPTDEVDYTYYTIEEPIKMINGKLYITSKGLSTACNLQMAYSQEQNQIVIYTLSYLTNYYVTQYSDAAIQNNFNNQKALLHGLLVVQSADNTEKSIDEKSVRYGIHDLNDEEIVGMKYTDIEFIEGTEEFIVTTEEEKVGIIASTGETKITPQYDALKQIDKDLNLYMATSNGKSGVIEKNGKILIYLEYEQIGVDTSKFPTNDIKNKYILFDNVIPVMQNSKWGLYDVKGNMILPVEYIGLGCVSKTSTDKTLNNILVIPEIEGIVICKQYDVDSKKYEYYGIVNSRGKVLVEPALETIYSVTSSGQEEYTMINNGNSYDVIAYIKQYVLNDNSSTGTNTNGNSNSNSSTKNLYNVENKVTCSNNVFEYENLYFDDYDEDMDSITIFMDEQKNISSEDANLAIKLKLYNENKECIGEYSKEFTTFGSMAPNESYNASYTIYANTNLSKTMYEGYSLKDVRYFTVEDI